MRKAVGPSDIGFKTQTIRLQISDIKKYIYTGCPALVGSETNTKQLVEKSDQWPETQSFDYAQ
jgi:hypothetical protein